MKAKRFLGLIFTVFMTLTAIIPARAEEEYLPKGYWNIAEPYRYVIFATDGGEYIRRLELPTGTTVDLTNYTPKKDGYIFDGWYSDPKTKQERVTQVTLDGNVVVYAKWIDDGTPKPQAEDTRVYLTNRQVLQFGNYVDADTGVPVTALWVQQNARLKALMQIYNSIFNQ